tara:strand:- start:4652 stop:5014 length:363 start_codon:yes stop_codon:yes gene_type:complete
MKSSEYFLSYVYLFLALSGGILTGLSNFDFIQAYGPSFDIAKFISLASDNPASESLSRDLLIGASSVTIWIIIESKRLQMRNLWIVLISNFLIAFAFAAPFFLFLRERRIIEIEREKSIK